MEVAGMQPDEYLQGHHICTLATATKAGTPHASAFWYASAGLDLYLAVDERCTTARNLSENPYVAGAIYADTADWRQASSLHFQGRAVLLTTPGDRTRAIEVFGRKFPETTMPDVPSAPLRPPPPGGPGRGRGVPAAEGPGGRGGGPPPGGVAPASSSPPGAGPRRT